jgi:hypothetical protein
MTSNGMTSSAKGPSFGAVVTAMGTPFTADGHIDEKGVGDLARWLVANGSDALVVTGSTGESGTLVDSDRTIFYLFNWVEAGSLIRSLSSRFKPIPYTVGGFGLPNAEY